MIGDLIPVKLLFIAVAVRVHPNKYDKDFHAVVAFLILYINKKTPAPSVKIASLAQTRPAK